MIRHLPQVIRNSLETLRNTPLPPAITSIIAGIMSSVNLSSEPCIAKIERGMLGRAKVPYQSR